MFDRKQLGWVLRNWRRRERTQSIGQAARGIIDGTQHTGAWPDESVRRLVWAMGDDEFRAHCVLGYVERGTLKIAVDDARRLYAYRLRWEQLLANRIATQCPGSGVRAVRFVQCCGGSVPV